MLVKHMKVEERVWLPITSKKLRSHLIVQLPLFNKIVASYFAGMWASATIKKEIEDQLGELLKAT